MRFLKILHVVSTLNPKYGGPVEGLKILVKAYNKNKINTEILCLDKKNSKWLKDRQLPKIFALGPSYFNYKLNFKILKWLNKNKKNYDAIIIDGVWQFHGICCMD